MDFFKRQDDARRQTRWLLAGFVLAFALVVGALDLVVFWLLGGHRPLRLLSANPRLALAVTLAIVGVVLGASARKWSALSAGGAAVALALGGEPVESGATEPARRRLINVVEEMAIAARIRAPEVYVIPDQPGINAFAAGHSVEDAAIAVTSGALAALNRDELQAVIGHEFSHVLNGDMRLNIRLIAWLYGLYVVTVIARRLMRNDAGGRRPLRLYLSGIAVLAVGSVGLLAGRVLQAAVSRRREQLADASAVQFTRNPAALKQALLKIAGHESGSMIASPAALELAHMFFADGEPSGWATLRAQLFATHPPIAERIKAIDPGFNPLSLRRLARAAARSAPPAEAVAEPAPPPRAATSAAPASVALAPPAPARAVVPGGRGDAADGYPTPVHLESQPAPQARSAAIAALRTAPQAAPAYALAALVAREPLRREQQLAAIGKVYGAERGAGIRAALAALDAAPPHDRLPALAAALTALAALDPAEQRRLRNALLALDERNPSPSVLQACFACLVRARLARSGGAAPQDRTLKESAGEVIALLAVLARVGHASRAVQQRAYAAGAAGLLPLAATPAYAPPTDWRGALARGFECLERLHPAVRRSLRDALARTVADDGRLSCEEAEILRSATCCLGLPMPNLNLTAVLANRDAVAQAAESAA